MGSRRNKVHDLTADWVAARDESVAARFAVPKPHQKPLTRNHLRYQDAIRSSKICLAVGPAGTGKTVLACQVAVELLKAGKIKQIVLTRPIVGCGGNLGYLPGNEVEKIGPYLAPLAKAIKRYLPPGEYEKLLKSETILIRTLETMRGETFEDAVVICDEAENASYEQIRMILTRLGENGKIVLNGDITQADVRPGASNPFAQAILKLRGNPDIKFVKMTRTDCLRPELVQWIDERLAGDR